MVPKWSQNGPWGPQESQNPICFFLGLILEAFCAQFGTPKGPQGEPKIVQKSNFSEKYDPGHRVFHVLGPCLFFLPFLIDFSSIFRGPDPHETSLWAMFREVFHFSEKALKR